MCAQHGYGNAASTALHQAVGSPRLVPCVCSMFIAEFMPASMGCDGARAYRKRMPEVTLQDEGFSFVCSLPYQTQHT